MAYVQASSGLHGTMVRGIGAKDCLSAEQLKIVKYRVVASSNGQDD